PAAGLVQGEEQGENLDQPAGVGPAEVVQPGAPAGGPQLALDNRAEHESLAARGPRRTSRYVAQASRLTYEAILTAFGKNDPTALWHCVVARSPDRATGPDRRSPHAPPGRPAVGSRGTVRRPCHNTRPTKPS